MFQGTDFYKIQKFRAEQMILEPDDDDDAKHGSPDSETFKIVHTVFQSPTYKTSTCSNQGIYISMAYVHLGSYKLIKNSWRISQVEALGSQFG